MPQERKRNNNRKLSKDEKRKIIQIYMTHPSEFGLPLARWTLRRLSQTLERFDIFVSHETVRKVLLENGIRFRKSKAYIQSPDPLYTEKVKMLKEIERNLPNSFSLCR